MDYLLKIYSQQQQQPRQRSPRQPTQPLTQHCAHVLVAQTFVCLSYLRYLPIFASLRFFVAHESPHKTTPRLTHTLLLNRWFRQSRTTLLNVFEEALQITTTFTNYKTLILHGCVTPSTTSELGIRTRHTTS